MIEIPLEKALSLVRCNRKARLNWQGFPVRVGTLKLNIIKQANAQCINCKQKAVKAVLTKNPNTDLQKASAILDFVTAKGVPLTIDHIKPRSKGGKRYAKQNMQCLCRTCNHHKGSKA